MKKSNGGDYEIGKGKPPKHTQFGKGQPINKKGRPRGSKNLATYLREAASKTVVATIDGKQRKITALHATTMQLALAAAKGHPSASAKFLDWIDKLETRAAAARQPDYPISDADIEIIREMHAVLMRNKPKKAGK